MLHFPAAILTHIPAHAYRWRYVSGVRGWLSPDRGQLHGGAARRVSLFDLRPHAGEVHRRELRRVQAHRAAWNSGLIALRSQSIAFDLNQARQTSHSLFKGGLWLGSGMQPIERAFLLMAIIGVIGFVATAIYMTR
jgi:hypothetical protein